MKVELSGKYTPDQQVAINQVILGLEEFLHAPNDTATERNNALQRLCGIARKTVQPPVPTKKK
jgi:hypothetical protein